MRKQMSRSIRFTSKKGEISAARMLKEVKGTSSALEVMPEVRDVLKIKIIRFQ